MHTGDYLATFQAVAKKMSTGLLKGTDLECWTGIYIDSPFIKLQKRSWTNTFPATPEDGSYIFFSTWVNDKIINENKLFYNIHALRLRALRGYSLTSRDFATAFRKKFAPYQNQWPHVSVAFGPQTLMEGWEELNNETLPSTIEEMVSRFLVISPIIDDLLNAKKK